MSYECEWTTSRIRQYSIKKQKIEWMSIIQFESWIWHEYLGWKGKENYVYEWCGDAIMNKTVHQFHSLYVRWESYKWCNDCFLSMLL
jgi:hypothetical protein